MAGEKNDGLVLLDFWVSPFGQRCRIALAEKGLPYKHVEEDLFGGKSDLLLRSNPVHKKIPVLLHDSKPINESLVILQYLDDAFPETPSLLPADPHARAHARFWADYIDKKVFEYGTRLWKLNGEPLRQARAEMLEILKTLESGGGARREGVLRRRARVRVCGRRVRPRNGLVPDVRELRGVQRRGGGAKASGVGGALRGEGERGQEPLLAGEGVRLHRRAKEEVGHRVSEKVRGKE